MKNPIAKHPASVIALLLLFMLHIVVFGLTDPLSSQVIVIVGGFLLVSFDIMISVMLLIRGAAKVMPGLRPHSKRIAVYVGGFLIVLLALSSIGQLTWRDVLAVVAIGGLAYFYSIYFRIGVSRRE